MMNLKTQLRTGALALALSAAAAPGFAQATFTRYVALGDSLTAGFQSGGLYVTSQRNSYPAIIAAQAGVADFQQPTVSDPGIPSALELRSLSPLIIAPKPGSGVPTNLSLARPYNNLAVPGADVHDTLFTTTDNGGLHDLILRRQNATALQQALVQQPTFVTLWIGNNDALGAATSGIVIDGVTLTTAASFEADFRAVTNAIAASGAKMAIANVPDVTSIPFVTTIPPFIVVNGAPLLIGGNPVPYIGPNGPLAANDFVLLTAQAELAQGKGIPVALGGSGLPLSNSSVLSASEAATIRSRVNSYNAVIAAVANEKGAALVDANAILTAIAHEGVDYGGITFNSKFLTGGIFSYDGVHPSRFGYALVALEFIHAINAKFGSDIPDPNLGAAMQGGGGGSLFSFDTASLELAPDFDANLRWALHVPSQADLEQQAQVKPKPRHRRRR